MIKRKIKSIIPSFLLGWYHFLLAFLAALIYGFPSRRIKVVGVTGTKGKSTVIELAHRILEEANFRVASISSIRFKIADKERKNDLKMTMPGRFQIQKFLRKAVKKGCQYALLEVTSEGILQHRHRFINFEAAVFTNLSPEHIERHGGFENYRLAKAKLFRSCDKIHILNLDDENLGYFLRFPAKRKYGYTLKNKNLENRKLETNWKFIKAAEARGSEKGISFQVDGLHFEMVLPADFNVYNALAAISIAQSQGIGLGVCRQALERIKNIPGRMETVIEKPFRVVVDYAHTPQSLEEVYQTLSSKFKIQNSKLICVLGSCGGGRDKWKRPEMGKIAARYCDEIILTNEDPYDEQPEKILEDIEKGILEIRNLKFNKNLKLKIKNYFTILDRREAIKKALAGAEAGDVVVITGKGSEPWMCLAGGKKMPWDDRRIVRQEYQKLKCNKIGRSSKFVTE